MRIFNSLTRKVEDFVPMRPPRVAMYTCGPTVYSYPTIGNWRTYVLSDLVFRVLTYMGLRVEYVMNLTDVGHLTSDADTGEDKLQEKAVREGKTAWEVAKFYGDDFVESFAKLNLSKPKLFSKATDHIKEQIELIGEIEKAGFVYKINDGVYFDVAAYEKAGNVYGELSNLEEIKAGARVEVNPEKKDSRDFALWKFSPSEYKRDMEWDSPWGRGFPGWHIECSAMSMKYLGKQLDIHLGGEDLLGTHHPNEIAQSEAATARKPFCKYWVHGAFLIVDGGKMGKSKGNAFTLNDIEAGGFDPLALRYFYLTGHYRKQLNFTWEALAAAGAALSKLRQFAAAFREQKGRTQPRGGTRDLRLSPEKLTQIDEFKKSFCDAVEDDLNMPEALAVVWEMVKSNIPDYDKYELLVKFDEILGFSLSDFWGERVEVSGKAEELLRKREELRAEKRFAEADQIREELNQMGYQVKDGPVP
ncbi:cysteine--tRNA ligase [Candidatus Collierbacteria bacterium RIFCSPHIGHO2_02_FULL_49_10]|uniref:Cysteine--tRNA ligase n=1 Tax=Candidatus Collierbacteria bacterium RIFCSPHIGHO2_02_FULL_49_10 TaxID=1817723 RepID=A0A1F5EU39_9BACT|nr:MAG: cysteine--tRNA ligase [Candidatus Collierbacteria bacterium RIFCSPHIGHO2_02_FULL_49_10]